MSTSGRDRIRQQWQQQEPTGKSAQAWLILRRTVFTILALGLIAAFGIGLFWILNSPKSYLAYYSASVYVPGGGAPIAFASGDYEKIASLKNSFDGNVLINPVDHWLTPEVLRNKLSGLGDLVNDKDDTLVVFITAHGRVNSAGEAVLLCEPSNEVDTIAMSEVFEKLAAVKAGTKLLILDAGRDTSAAAGDGESIKFSELVGSAVDNVNKGAEHPVWVLCANTSYEHSHVSPTLKRSLFSYAISEGLGGKADDEEDPDGAIDLNELYNYVRNNVSTWVKDKESPRDTQTPQLYPQSDPNVLKKKHLVVVSESPPEEAAESAPEHHDEVAESGWKSRFTENATELLRIDELQKTKEKFSRNLGLGQQSEEATDEQQADKAGAAPEAHATDSPGKHADSKPASETKVDKAAANKNQVAEAWKKIGEIESRPIELRPAVANSRRWDQLKRTLLWCEQVTAAGVPSEFQKPWRRFDDVFGIVDTFLDSVPGRNRPRQTLGEERITLALMEQSGASEGLRGFIEKYDQLLLREAIPGGAGSSEALKQELSALVLPAPVPDTASASKEAAAPAEDHHLNEYYELRLVERLCKEAEVDWNLAQLILSTRRLGEQVALNAMAANEGWRKSIEDADSLRLEGERVVLDRTVNEWKSRGVQKLRNAQFNYNAAKKAADDVQLASQARNAVVFSATDYVRWAQLCNADEQELKTVDGIFSSLQDLDVVLAAPGSKDFKALKDLLDNVGRFNEKASVSKSPWRIANYLATVLPNPTERAGLSTRMLDSDSGNKYSLDNMPAPDVNPSQGNADKLAQLHETAKKLANLGSNGPAVTSGEANWHDVLKWNSERFHRAVDDAPEDEVPFLRYAAQSYRTLANELDAPDQTKLNQFPGPTLSFGEFSREIHLETAEQQELTLTVNSNAAGPTPVWLVAQYDEELLDVKGESTWMISQIALEKGAAPDAKYPINPSVLKERPTPYSLPGGSTNFKLAIERKKNAKARGNAKLILKAISGNDASNDYVRREINVNLPGGGAVDIAVANQPDDIWDQENHALHPLPNKAQDFSFNVLNLAKIAQKVEVSFWTPQTRPKVVELPPGPQKQEGAKRSLKGFETLTPFGPRIPVELPASGEPVRLSLLASDPTIPPATNLLAFPKDVEGISLGNGLIAQLKNMATNVDEVTLRHIEITPIRPSSYLSATARCDRTGRLQIDVKCTKPVILGDKILNLVARSASFSEPRPNNLKADLKGSATASMYGYLKADESDIVVYVDVDKYPRVFSFLIPIVGETDPIKPRIGEPQVQIKVPVSGRPPYAFKAPIVNLPVDIAIDAPPEDFEEGRAVVQVGIDEPPAHTPVGDRVVTLNSDRDVTVVAKSLSPDGILVVDSSVSDFRRRLSPDNSNQDLELIAWIMEGEKVKAESNPVRILFDGAPPAIDAAFPDIQARDSRERKIESGSDLVIHVFPRKGEPDLSGIAKVQAIFEKPIVPGQKPELWQDGVEHNDGRKWVVKLKVDGNVGMGKKQILIKAMDKVGNESEPLQEWVQIVPKAVVAKQVAAAKKPVPVTNEIPIQVLWGTEPIPATLTLVPTTGPPIAPATTDQKGQHTFTKVPPGKYTLTVRTTEPRQNGFPTGKQEITVPAPPQKLARINVGVK